MTAGARWAAVGAGLLAGIAAGFFGVGGGVVLIPLLTGYFHLSQHQAHGTSLAVIGVTALVALIIYGVFSNVAWGTAALVGVASLVTAQYGARLASRTSLRGLTRGFAIFLLAVALRLLWRMPHPAWQGAHHDLRGVAVDLGLGLAVGLLSGYMGVGGGILAVSAFTLFLGMPQHLAQGTSLAVILMAAPAGAIEHARHGNLVVRLVPMLALGAALGAPLASLLAQHLPQPLLVRAFAIFLLANAVHTWIRANRKPSPPGERSLQP
jgi:hypothetical protein